jgi:hypothetical protein
MATKLGRKEIPKGIDPTSFKYQGRPAGDQDDFGSDVGLVDMACVNQFGDSNNSKYYHGGVVAVSGQWFVYLEWGRISGGKSWNGSFNGGDYQFVQCSSESDARDFFQKQCRDKNIKRLEQKKIGSNTIWVGKAGKDGYIVQRLATRERGLPDAYVIKDDSGVQKAAKPAETAAKKAPKTKKIDAHPEVVRLASSLVGGTSDYARAASQATGIVPTMAAIVEVRDQLIPEALVLLQTIGPDEGKQLKSVKLQDLSKYVATIVPRPIPRGGDPSAILLSSANIFRIQQDLDTFESALKNEDFDQIEIQNNTIDPNSVLGRQISWVDPTSTRGRWVTNTFQSMTNNRHSHLRSGFKILNLFEVEKPEFRSEFLQRANTIAKTRKGDTLHRAGLQPSKRTDVSDIADIYDEANICLGIHGTRAVNVQPILSSNLRMPKSLKGVHISGSAFGAGVYFATDARKAHGYTGDGLYGGGGSIKGRGFFMFMCDLILGKPYMAKTTMWDTVDCPKGHDSVFAEQGRTSVANDEHVIFDAHQQYIRYIVEGTVG